MADVACIRCRIIEHKYPNSALAALPFGFAGVAGESNLWKSAISIGICAALVVLALLAVG